MGWIDRTGIVAYRPAFYDRGSPFSEGLAAVTVEGRYGYVDRHGSMRVPPQFRFVRSFSEGLPAASNRLSNEGFINTSGNFVIPDRFDETEDFHEGLCWVAIRRTDGNINGAGEMIWKGNRRLPEC